MRKPQRALARRQYQQRLVKRRRISRSGALLGASVLFAASLLAVFADRLFSPDAFPVTQVQIEGKFNQIDPATVKTAILPAIRGNIFAIDLDKIQISAEKLSWISAASVRRAWPDGVRVAITEHQPVARWNHSRWLDNRGRILELPSFKNNSLVSLIGPDNVAPLQLKTLFKFQPQLEKSGFTLLELKINSRRALTLTVEHSGLTDQLTLKLGSEKYNDRLQRFLNTYQTFDTERFAQLKTIDLRYPNGFAVSWRNSFMTKPGPDQVALR